MTSPDHVSPDRTQSGSTVGPYYQNADPNLIGAGANSEMNSLLSILQNNLLTKLLKGFLDVGAAVADGITSVVEAITGIFGGTLGDLDLWATQIRDGQLDLNDQVELLSPLQDYGSCYAAGSGDLINVGKVPFSNQIGPMTNCHLGSSGIVLHDYGLWDIRCRLAFSWTAGGGAIAWEVRVVNDSTGSTFSTTQDYVTTSERTTREICTTVVVPNDGRRYRVEAWITALIVGRSTQGGPSQNRLTAQHITRSTSFPV